MNVIAVFLRCAEPLDFDAADGTPVDMVLAVVFPGGIATRKPCIT